jgi:cellulose synthase/poly-beta-1,6-N-acetylglucosamine synthase-like glycosyltransferase
VAYAADRAARLAHGGQVDPAHVAAGLATALAVIRRAPLPVRAPRPSLAFRRKVDPCPELDCVRHRLSPATIAAAEQRALVLGVGADEILIASGAIAEGDYYEALAQSLGIAFVDLDAVPRELCPLTDTELIGAAAGGLLPLKARERMLAVAPRGLALRVLLGRVRADDDLHRRLLLTTPSRLACFAYRHAAAAITARAADGLRAVQPAMSAATPPWRARAVAAGIVALGALALATNPGAALGVLSIVLSALFLAWSALRIASVLHSPPPLAAARTADCDLPIYSIVVALYREQAALPGLVEALGALDYPVEKLDITIALEADDLETQAAAANLALRRPFDVVLVPPAEPRTKPKALNFALPRVRGAFVAVYDAEDRPEPDQLRAALAAFAQGGDALACVQARLTIDNTEDSRLARQFTAEYAGLYDVLLPGLDAFRLPIPLGGTSNHFRTAILREVGAWDSYNVTEDADLGMRLARRGYRCGVIASSTFEEAPATLRPWLKQRTRWFKGWMQTWCVHIRNPFQLWRELGTRGLLAFQLLLIGAVLSALLQPLVLAMIALRAFKPDLFAAIDTFGIPGLGAGHMGALVCGYATSIVLAVKGLHRRRLLTTAWLKPRMLAHWLLLHWMLLSLAAWRALFQFLFDRYRWEKTEHGLARTSRRGVIAAVKDSAADPLPPLRAAA